LGKREEKAGRNMFVASPLLPYPFPVYPCNTGWYTNMVVTKGLQGEKTKNKKQIV